MVMFFTLLVPFLYTLAIMLLSCVFVLKFKEGLFNMGVEVMSSGRAESKWQWVVFRNKAV